MAGLRRICRQFGGMTIQGVKWVWDYVAEEPVKETEMPFGSERHAASEREKYRLIAEQDSASAAAAEGRDGAARLGAKPGRAARSEAKGDAQ